MKSAKRICGVHRMIFQDKCPRCVAEREKRRQSRPAKAGDPFYVSGVWKKMRSAKLANDPLCERCAAVNVVKAASEVHHKLARREHPLLELVYENLESVCRRCHRFYTVQEIRERKQS